MKQQTQINKIEWREVELKDLIDCVENGNRPKGGVGNLKEGIPSIGGEHINKHGGFNFSNIKFISKEFFDSQRRGIIQKGDVLVVKDGATTGRVTLASEENFPYNKALVNEHVFILRPKESIIFSKFLFFFLYSLRGQKKILDNFHGSAQGGINTQFVKNVTIPVPFSDGKPDLKEQEKIVLILEDAKKQIKRSEKAENLFDEYLKSVFAEMFLKNMDKWEIIRMGDIFEIVRGGSPRPIQDYITQEKEGINWIKIGDTKGDSKYIYQTEEKIKPEGLKKSRLVKIGDFILSNSMSFGRPYILRTEGGIHDGWLLIRDTNKKTNENYLYSILISDYVYSQFISSASGSTVKNLNIDLVRKVKIPLPPLYLQQEFSQIVEQVEIMKVKINKTKQGAKELFDSLMSKAFRGEL